MNSETKRYVFMESPGTDPCTVELWWSAAIPSKHLSLRLTQITIQPSSQRLTAVSCSCCPVSAKANIVPQGTLGNT